MTEIKRYDVVSVDGVPAHRPSESGRWVKHEDHAAIVAALQEQVRSLAAENADLKDINSWCRTEAFQNMYREFKTAEAIGCADVDCMHDAMLAAIMHAPKTPATDAALREIRAQAVEGFADYIAFYYSGAKQIASYYAASIRAGEQP